ncbi:MAG: LLM class flavin-dependent oxidoreductase [Nonomuraea sp.]|nr:LLM class flavin-dependent oxidoreductase [Nonomuraea sp.]
MNALGLGRVGIWAGETDRYPAPALRQAAAVIEDLGYPALWFPETTGREAMTQAALLLSATRRNAPAAPTRWACRSSTPAGPEACSGRTRCWLSPGLSCWTHPAPARPS